MARLARGSPVALSPSLCLAGRFDHPLFLITSPQHSPVFVPQSNVSLAVWLSLSLSLRIEGLPIGVAPDPPAGPAGPAGGSGRGARLGACKNQFPHKTLSTE